MFVVLWLEFKWELPLLFSPPQVSHMCMDIPAPTGLTHVYGHRSSIPSASLPPHTPACDLSLDLGVYIPAVGFTAGSEDPGKRPMQQNEYSKFVPQVKTLAAFDINLEMFAQSTICWLCTPALSLMLYGDKGTRRESSTSVKTG